MYACLFIKVIQIVMIKPHKLTPQKNCTISDFYKRILENEKFVLASFWPFCGGEER